MWSLTSQRKRRTSGPKNFQSEAIKDFFNTIRQQRSFVYPLLWNVGGCFGRLEHLQRRAADPKIPSLWFRNTESDENQHDLLQRS
jgi:hypothetical protein